MRIGMVGRFFPANWRPVSEEIRFAADAGFDAIQLRSDAPGTVAEHLGAPLPAVRALLQERGVSIVLEMLVRVDEQGRTDDGDTLAGALARNVEAVEALGCRRVHIHPVAPGLRLPVCELEERLVPAFAEAARLGAERGLVFGFEHNAPDQRLFASPESCARLLDEVPELGFVWDLNHTAPDSIRAFERLAGRATLVHASDTPLPEMNHHLPIGLGSVDFPARLAALAGAGYDGPVVLEIGGLPKSGGYGRDTDDALRDSLARLAAAA